MKKSNLSYALKEKKTKTIRKYFELVSWVTNDCSSFQPWGSKSGVTAVPQVTLPVLSRGSKAVFDDYFAAVTKPSMSLATLHTITATGRVGVIGVRRGGGAGMVRFEFRSSSFSLPWGFRGGRS